VSSSRARRSLGKPLAPGVLDRFEDSRRATVVRERHAHALLFRHVAFYISDPQVEKQVAPNCGLLFGASDVLIGYLAVRNCRGTKNRNATRSASSLGMNLASRILALSPRPSSTRSSPGCSHASTMPLP
jgi:hypothetical protein